MARPKNPALRAQLLDAAERVLGEHGFGGATIEAIGEEAGVTKGGVYFHFRSKEELFFAVLDRFRVRVRNATRRPVIGPLAPAADAAVGSESAAVGGGSLHRFLTAYFRVHLEAPHGVFLPRVLATELRGRFTTALRQDLRDEQAWLRGQIRELLILGEYEGGLFATDPAWSAFLLAGSVLGVLEQWQTAPAEVTGYCDCEELATALVAAWTTGAAPRERPAGVDVPVV